MMQKNFKNLLLFAMLFVNTSLFSQIEDCIIYFKEGDTLHGLGTIDKHDKILFKLDKESKVEEFDSTIVSRIDFENYLETKSFEYVYIKSEFSSQKKVLLMELVKDGAVRLYKAIEHGAFESDYLTLNNNKTKNKVNKLTENSSLSKIATAESNDAFWIQPQNSSTAFPVKRYINTRSKKLSEYFKNCPILFKKIKKQEINSIIEMVDYYNNFCSDE